jgi:UDP-N-acetylmuramoylalanine--D-glutamate ligase
MSLPTSWHADWSNLKAVVLGLAKSGFSAVDTLVELGVETVAVGAGARPEVIEMTEVIGSRFIEGEDPAILEELGFKPDFAVVSPGFRPTHPMVEGLSKMGIPLITDIDLAWRLRDKVAEGSWIAITGTNGKTTTCELVSHILNASGRRAVACGNIGSPILDAIRDPIGFDYLVVELSSFQLHYLGQIHPVASAFLNFAEDHVDWHGSLENYFDAKAKVFLGTEKAIVFNEQDGKTLEAAKAADVIEGCRAIGFSLFTPQPSSVGYVEDILVDRAFLDNRKEQALEIVTEADLAEIGLVSDQLKANVAAATALVRAIDVSPAEIKHGLSSFQLSPHRNQLVAASSGISYVNDSKATNPHAANSSLSSYESVIWIMGGDFKGTDPRELIQTHAKRLKAVVIIGKTSDQTARLVTELLPGAQVTVISGDEVMSQAVSAAASLAKAGDTVLLAPAAASIDQFRDYAERGEKFIEAVRELK